MQVIADGSDRQVRFLVDRGLAGGDRIEPGLQWSKPGQQSFGINSRNREAANDVADVIGFEIAHALGGIRRHKRSELSGFRELRPLLNEAGASDGDFEFRLQRFG